MNNQLNISVSGLRKSLEKALDSSDIADKIGLAAKAASQTISQANRAQYPEIQTNIARTGKYSLAISFSAPMLWTRSFGSQSAPAQPFVTNVKFGGLRGDA